MIKLLAALTMLIDHLGVILFPEIKVLRVVGRLAMPLFAYCIARGFYYSKQHGTLLHYCRNMVVLAMVSQVPFHMMQGHGFNIGFTWLFSLLLLMTATAPMEKRWHGYALCGAMLLVVAGLIETVAFDVDYGLCGVITPLLFYYLIHTGKENLINYVLVTIISWSVYVACSGSVASMAQIFSVASAFVLVISKKHDKVVRLPKWFFYGFYPVHIMVLLLIRQLLF